VIASWNHEVERKLLLAIAGVVLPQPEGPSREEKFATPDLHGDGVDRANAAITDLADASHRACRCRRKFKDDIDRMKIEASDVSLVAVGGGPFLVPDRLSGISEIVRVPHGDCAKAVARRSRK
jgi:hypothetical protein